MTRPVISAERLGKQYKIGGGLASYDTLRDAVAGAASAPIRALRSSKTKDANGRRAVNEIWAIKDVTFTIDEGELVGLIGRNGAGKSTLLKILSRVTHPTVGRARLRGRVGSLLEVGTGFHSELTGRENIYLSGAILGMTRADIRRRFDEIVEFSGIGRFLDTAVKYYSSGMEARLGFAVAAHLEPDILLVDEVLAVGDVEFQRRCLGRMDEVSREGRTLIFVSHSMAAIEALCRRAIHVEEGCIAYDGATDAAIASYLASASQVSPSEVQPGVFDLSTSERKLSEGPKILRRVTFEGDDGLPTHAIRMGRALGIVIDLAGFRDVPSGLIGMRIKSELEQVLATVTTRMRPLPTSRTPAIEEQVVCRIPHLPLTPGRYWLDLNIKDGKQNRLIDAVEHAASLHVVGSDVYGTGHEVTHGHGVFFLNFTWEIRENTAPGATLGIVKNQ